MHKYKNGFQNSPFSAETGKRKIANEQNRAKLSRGYFCRERNSYLLPFSQVDVYSFGVLLCEMCIREQPDPQQIHNQLGRVSGPVRGLILQCVEKDPEARPTMSEVICKLEQF